MTTAEAGERTEVRFASGTTSCAAWHYRGTNGACVVMAGGLAVTKEPGTDRFARRFHEAGFTVLAFDPRHFGESGGEPRQVARLREQQADWDAAIAFARALPEVDPDRLAIWGFSLAGGQVLAVAARHQELAAAIAQTPLMDGRAATPNAMRHQRPLALLRFTGRALLDGIGRLAGREPLLVPLAGEPGTVTSLTTPDSLNGPAALNPGNRYPDWQQEVAAWSAFRIGFYRPIRHARRVSCPLLVLVHADDGVVPAGAATRAAERAPRGKLVRLPGGHYEPFMGGHEDAAQVEIDFLRENAI